MLIKIKSIKWNNNHVAIKLLGMLFILMLALIPLWVCIEKGEFDTGGGWKDSHFSISADSLITTATVTLIVFTNFAPNNSSGSSSIIRRIYWRSSSLTTNSAKRHGFWWFISIAWVTPPAIILLTLITTLIEVFAINYQTYICVVYAMFIITCVLLITSLMRFYIFHIYSNKNVAFWLFEKMKSNAYLSEFVSIKSPTLDLLSFFRQTNNYELIFVVVKKFSDNACEFLPKGKKYFSHTIKNNTKAHEDLLHPTFPFVFNYKDQTQKDEIRMRLLALFYYNIMSNESFKNRDSVKVKHIRNMFMSILRRDTINKLELMSEMEKKVKDDNPSNEPSKIEIN